jgi:hypothetical protein
MGAPLYSLAAMILRLLSHEAHLLIGQNLRRTDPGIGEKRGLLPVLADHGAGLDRQLHRGKAQGLAGDGSFTPSISNMTRPGLTLQAQ